MRLRRDGVWGRKQLLRERGIPASPRLTPQLTGKAIHIVEFPWVAPPIAPHPWKAATVAIATRTGLGDRIPDKTRMCAPGAPKNHLSSGASSPSSPPCVPPHRTVRSESHPASQLSKPSSKAACRCRGAAMVAELRRQASWASTKVSA